MIQKVLLICESCLRTKQVDPTKGDPVETRYIVTDACDKCNEETLDSPRLFDRNFKPLISKPKT